jgi:hypothetical protein
MANYLIKTAESNVKQDKRTRNYKTVTFTECVMMETPFGKVPKPSAQCLSTAINCYEENYLGKMDLGWGDPIFDAKNPAKGGIYEGAICQRPVEEYEIISQDGTVRQVSTYKTVVFGDTDSPAFESLVRAAFKSKGHQIIESPKEESFADLQTRLNIVSADSLVDNNLPL